MKNYSGINIQWPISELILSGQKVVETRTYPIPEKYIGQEVLLVETPGKKGKFRARIRAKIVIHRSFKYPSPLEFYADFSRHKVDRKSEWAWKDKPKYGWEIEVLKIFDNPIPCKTRGGIIFRSNLKIKED